MGDGTRLALPQKKKKKKKREAAAGEYIDELFCLACGRQAPPPHPLISEAIVILFVFSRMILYATVNNNTEK